MFWAILRIVTLIVTTTNDRMIELTTAYKYSLDSL